MWKNEEGDPRRPLDELVLPALGALAELHDPPGVVFAENGLVGIAENLQ